MLVDNVSTAFQLARKKNRYVLADVRRPAKRNRVNLDWWQPPTGPANLGDYLSPVVVEWMLAQRGLSLDQPVAQTRFMTTVGSVLGTGLNTTTVWGSGLLKYAYAPHVRPLFKKLDVRAVRGPKTAASLRERGYACPDVFGDPAILLPRIYQPKEHVARCGALRVSHVKDAALFGDDSFGMQTEDYRSYVDAAAAAELVVTSSLHAIILAECYGTPAVLVRSERSDFSLFKYEDWYLSTGREAFPVAASVEEALILRPPRLPDAAVLEELRQGLVETFPYDLWES